MTETTERKPPNAWELHAIEYLAIMDNNLALGKEKLHERLSTIPNGWRDFCLAQKTTERVLDRIYETLPAKTLKHIVNLYKNGEIIIRPKPAIKRTDGVQIVLDEDLSLLINTVIADECAMCVRSAAEQKQCRLRRVLENIAPTEAMHKNGLCTYVDVATDNAMGDYMKN